MKAKTLLISSLAFLAAMASCKKEQMAEPEVNPSKGGETITGEYTYTFAVNQPTKTVFGEDCIVWENGDEVGSYAEQDGEVVSSNKSTKVEIGDEHVIIKLRTSKALKKGDKAYFYFPFSTDNNEKAPTEVAMQIPSEQVSGDADAMPMAAVPFEIQGDVPSYTDTEVGILSFVNLGSVIKFNIFSSNVDYRGETIRNVTFNAEAPCAGSFTYDITSVDKASMTPISGYTEERVDVSGHNAVVGTDKDNGGVIFVVVAPGSYQGSLAIHTDRADYIYTFDKALTYSRAGLKPVNVDLAGAKWTSSTDVDHNIDSPRELVAFLGSTSSSDTGTYTITADLDMKGLKVPEATGFAGTLNGNGHRVYNITAGKALFASNKGTIKNLTLEGSFSSSTEYFLASLVKEDAGGVYDNVINKASVTFTATADVSSGMALGGLVAAAKGADFDNCYNYGDVVINAEGHYHSALGMGGFAGYSLGNTTMDKCYNYGTVKVLAKAAKTRTNIVIWGKEYTNNNVAVAGFVGRDLTTFASADDCTEDNLKANALAINQCENKKGADVVVSYSDINILGSSGEGYASVAGIAGMGNVYIYKCLNYADVKTSALGGAAVSKKELIMRVGGILGRPYDYCHVGSSKMEGDLTYVNDNTCDIANSKAAVGGIVGNGGYNGTHGSGATGLVEIYYNTMNGDIAASGKGKNYSVGGIVGHGGKQISNKVNASCSITLNDESNSGWKFVGGLVGTLAGTSKYTTVKSSTCAATINVTSGKSDGSIWVGGLLGQWMGAQTGDYPCLTERDGTPCAFSGSVSCTQTKYTGAIIGEVKKASSVTKFGNSGNPIQASGTFQGNAITADNIETVAIGTKDNTTIYVTAPAAPPAPKGTTFNAMSFNIREGSNWSSRKSPICSMINGESPDIIGLQEVKDLDFFDHLTEDHPWDYIKNHVSGYTGVRPNKKGNAFLYKTSRFEISNSGSFNIEDTDYDRCVLYATVHDKTNNKDFFYLTGHFPLGQSARTKAVEDAEKKISDLNTNDYPVVFMGDFNGVNGDVCFNNLKGYMNNTRYSATSVLSKENVDLYTYNAFGDGTKDRNKVDHIWVSKNGLFTTYYLTLTQEIRKYGDIAYLSDHYPVVATLSF